MLQPAGPEEDDDDDGDNDDEESTDEEGEREESVDMEEYKHAILELEGLKVSDRHVSVQAQEDHVKDDKDKQEEEQRHAETELSAKSDGDTEKDTEEELKEAEDDCPELADLSASNKEFKPFR